MKETIVRIKTINWIDEEALEAAVQFEISGEDFWAFCHPCDFRVGENPVVSLTSIEEEIAENLFWDENKEQKKKILASSNNQLRYYCYGILKQIHPVIIDCGVVDIPLGDWINDEGALGHYVYFVISRLDINRDNARISASRDYK